jgi:hypothetical protein
MSSLRIDIRRRTKRTKEDSFPVISRRPPQLPVERWVKIFSLLELPDIKSIRAAWKEWTNIGARFLFKPLVFRGDRKDLEHFRDNAKSLSLLAGINSLRFENGVMDIFNATSTIVLHYISEYNQELRTAKK